MKESEKALPGLVLKIAEQVMNNIPRRFAIAHFNEKMDI
jgi:hypothetical protein